MYLKEQLTFLYNWAEDKNILLLNADINSNRSLSVKFDGTSETGIKDFTKLIETLDGKIVFLFSLTLTDSDYDYYAGHLSKLNNEELKINFLKLEPYINEVLHIHLYFIDNGTIYEIENSLEEAFIFQEIQSALIEIINKRNELPFEKANILGRQLASDERFSIAKNRTQRKFLAKQMFPELLEYDGDAISEISQIAETIFEMEIKPQQETQLSERIQQLKNEGKTKVAICQELKINKDKLNKYY